MSNPEEFLAESLEESEDRLWNVLLSETPDHELARQIVIEAEAKDDGTGAAAAAIGYLWYMTPDDNRERTVNGRRARARTRTGSASTSGAPVSRPLPL